jgi:hypothetical protein
VAWLADSKLAADEVEFEDSRWQGVEEEILCRDDTGREVNDIAIKEGGGLGAPSDEHKGRGNYADGSIVNETVYNYSAVALGPLACHMNLGVQGTVKPKVDHVGHCLPTRWWESPSRRRRVEGVTLGGLISPFGD